jgi:hypothetical protein
MKRTHQSNFRKRKHLKRIVISNFPLFTGMQKDQLLKMLSHCRNHDDMDQFEVTLDRWVKEENTEVLSPRAKLMRVRAGAESACLLEVES